MGAHRLVGRSPYDIVARRLGSIYQLFKCTTNDEATRLLGSASTHLHACAHRHPRHRILTAALSLIERDGGKLISRRFNNYMTVESYKRILCSCYK